MDIENKLFKASADEYGDNYQTHYLEIYKL